MIIANFMSFDERERNRTAVILIPRDSGFQLSITLIIFLTSGSLIKCIEILKALKNYSFPLRANKYSQEKRTQTDEIRDPSISLISPVINS